jgi:glycosyltransferase involved in cell wall biosynthesis
MIKSIGNKELSEYYQKADVYATAIKYGGIAIPVLEAMSSGLPIIQCPSSFVKTPEFIGESGLVVEASAVSFAEGINKLKYDSELRQNMGAFARNKMLAHSSEKMDALEIQVYKRTLSS